MHTVLLNKKPNKNAKSKAVVFFCFVSVLPPPCVNKPGRKMARLGVNINRKSKKTFKIICRKQLKCQYKCHSVG